MSTGTRASRRAIAALAVSFVASGALGGAIGADLAGAGPIGIAIASFAFSLIVGCFVWFALRTVGDPVAQQRLGTILGALVILSGMMGIITALAAALLR